MSKPKKLDLSQLSKLSGIDGITPEMLEAIKTNIGVKEVTKVAGGKGKQVLEHLNSITERTDEQEKLREALVMLFNSKDVINSSKVMIEISNELYPSITKGIELNDNWTDLAKKGKKKDNK
mgnify:FL=1